MENKKTYQVVDMQIILCSQEDVITASIDAVGNFVDDPWAEKSFGG